MPESARSKSALINLGKRLMKRLGESEFKDTLSFAPRNIA